ncbi:hypothetical protein PR048_011447 [Dryococelus australis]|uniref:DDE-1 domain-containing protein n=1 Tax=Dryococelus australis TaxID=614101 RepID=A0ABQ9HM40_9NEOP|nr:hypothetical protein PR048_011447 [Dryococelus australis]
MKDNASHLWNVDEIGLCYVVKSNKIATEIGNCFVYKSEYADRAETHTLDGCICADGTWIQPFVIFKGVRWKSSERSLPSSRARLSPKGWITSDLNLGWFQFFIHSIPPDRPVVLFMNSHSSRIAPEVIQLAREQQMFLLTFPSHTSHLFPLLDVGVYRALKCNWRKELNSYTKKHPEKTQPWTFLRAFQPSVHRDVHCSDDTKLFQEELLKLPHITRNQTQNVSKKRDGLAKCHNPPSGLSKKSRNNLGRETKRPADQDEHSKPNLMIQTGHVVPAKENTLQISRRKLEFHGSSALFVSLHTMNHERTRHLSSLMSDKEFTDLLISQFPVNYQKQFTGNIYRALSEFRYHLIRAYRLEANTYCQSGQGL